MGLYEMYVLAARADTALMRPKIMNRQRKRQCFHNQKVNSDLESGPAREAHLRPGGFRKYIFI